MAINCVPWPIFFTFLIRKIIHRTKINRTEPGSNVVYSIMFVLKFVICRIGEMGLSSKEKWEAWIPKFKLYRYYNMVVGCM